MVAVVIAEIWHALGDLAYGALLMAWAYVVFRIGCAIGRATHRWWMP